MYLTEADAALFYKLMFSLQFYVSQQLNLQQKAKTQEAYNKLDQQTKLKVRNAVYEHPAMIDAFVKENPANFAAAELAIVAEWKHFVVGDFFIERYLKKYSIWIGGGSPAKVYGVLGISQPIEDFIDRSYLPLRVQSVLLPFKGQIIYDGLLIPYNILFGGGIKAELKEEYLAAKQNGRILETLMSTAAAAPIASAAKPRRDWSAEIAEIIKLTGQLKGQNVPVQSEAFGLLKAAAELAHLAVQETDHQTELEKQRKKVQRMLDKLAAVLYRME